MAVNANMDMASRALGQTAFGTLRRVHLPILRPSLLTALLIVFVDVMKELPATLILRPFNYDTLAVQAYRLASDERVQPWPKNRLAGHLRPRANDPAARARAAQAAAPRDV